MSPRSAPLADERDSWHVARRLAYTRTHRVMNGLPQFGFHVGDDVYAVEYAAGWVGQVHEGRVAWTIGPADPGVAGRHVPVALREPRFVAPHGAGAILIVDAGHVWRVELPEVEAAVFADAADLGLTDPGNCVTGADGRCWVNDIVGHQVIELSPDGRVVRRIGDGVAGFQRGTVRAEEARFGWIYDLRLGPDGRIYVLDSTNYAVRVIDPASGAVTTICGDGHPGSRGDGGPALEARLGGDPAAHFDGPWSLVVDARGDVYIGDTHNHAVRRIDAVTGRITTVASASSPSPPIERADGLVEAAGGRSPGPLFTKICGMDIDQVADLLFVPDWVGEEYDELLVLAPGEAPRRGR